MLSTSFSRLRISFYLRQDRGNKQAHPVYARLTWFGEQKNMPTGQFCSSQMWADWRKHDFSKTLVKAMASSLQRFEFNCHESLDIHIKQGLPFSLTSIVNHLVGKQRGWDTTLLEFWSEFNAELEVNVGIRHSRTLLEKHRRSSSYFGEFLLSHEHCSDIRLLLLLPRHIDAFFSFLRRQKQLSHNTAIKHMQQLKRVIRVALCEGIIKSDPFRRFSMALRPVIPRFLSVHELNRLQAVNLPIHRVSLVRDLFMFSCFTGLAYSDLQSLKLSDITEVYGRPWIFAHRLKTRSLAQIPLINDAQILLERYKALAPAGYSFAFPRISNQKLNTYLKEVGHLANIDKVLIFHMARHTFATTIALQHGMSIESLSKVMGHHSIKSTEYYAKLMSKRIGQEMSEIEAAFTTHKI
jgi:site-specific recombinase XerD